MTKTYYNQDPIGVIKSAEKLCLESELDAALLMTLYIEACDAPLPDNFKMFMESNKLPNGLSATDIIEATTQTLSGFIMSHNLEVGFARFISILNFEFLGEGLYEFDEDYFDQLVIIRYGEEAAAFLDGEAILTAAPANEDFQKDVLSLVNAIHPTGPTYSLDETGEIIIPDLDIKDFDSWAAIETYYQVTGELSKGPSKETLDSASEIRPL